MPNSIPININQPFDFDLYNKKKQEKENLKNLLSTEKPTIGLDEFSNFLNPRMSFTPENLQPVNRSPVNLNIDKTTSPEERELNIPPDISGFKQNNNTDTTSTDFPKYLQDLIGKKIPNRTSTIDSIKQYTRPSDYQARTTSRPERIMNIGNTLAGIAGLFDRSEQGKEWGRNLIGQTSKDIMGGFKSDRDLMNQADLYNREEGLKYDQLNSGVDEANIGNQLRLAGLQSSQDQAQMNYDTSIARMLQNYEQQREANQLKELALSIKDGGSNYKPPTGSLFKAIEDNLRRKKSILGFGGTPTIQEVQEEFVKLSNPAILELIKERQMLLGN